MSGDTKREIGEAKAEARGQLDRMIERARTSLEFAPPEAWAVHLDRLAVDACQAGIDMTRRIQEILR